MATTTSKPSKVGSNFYTTSVTTNTDGSLKATTSRTDAQGNNGIPVSTVNTTSTGQTTRTFESGATASEKTAFNNPRSPERRAYTQQVQSQNPYGVNPTAEQQKATNAAAGNPNAATDGSTDGSTVAAGPAESGKAAGGTKTGAGSFGDFVYPEGIRNSKQDVIKFTMLEYKPSGTGATQSAGKSDRGSTAGGNFKERTILGSVVLPIPNNISDTNSMDWGSNSMNALEAGLAAAAFTGITGGIGKGVETLGSGFQAGADDPATKRAIGAAFAGAAVGGNSAAILSRADGAVINPNLELLFNGPQLRPFNFTFKLAAREKKESEQIIKILNFFKRGSSAIKTESNLFLKAPHTFGIQYLHMGQGGKDHQFIGRIKECALQSITTNYTPEGQYATFNDGVMVSYQITMQFSELEPIFNSDYDNIEGIGF